MQEKYDTLGNGGLMYRVFDTGHTLRILQPYEAANNIPDEIDPELEDWVEGPQFKKSEIEIPYTRVWFAEDPEYPEKGFEILAELNCYEDTCVYVYIGTSITFFWASPHIEIYKSHVGNSGVPYGFAANRDYVYGFSHGPEKVIAVSRKRIETQLKKSLSDELTMDEFWDVTVKIMENPYASVKQETIHNAFENADYTAFDQVKFQQVMRKTRQLGKKRDNYTNTVLALGSKVPMNVAREIASYRTGLAYRKNRAPNMVPNNGVPVIFHGSIVPHNGVPVVVPKKKCTGCAVMGGTRRKKRMTKRRTRRSA
jgi:hypothetical protein